MGFYLSIFSGISNIFLDWLLVGVFGMGLSGAAIATVCGFMVSGLIPVFYFFCQQSQPTSIYKIRQGCGNDPTQYG